MYKLNAYKKPIPGEFRAQGYTHMSQVKRTKAVGAALAKTLQKPSLQIVRKNGDLFPKYELSLLRSKFPKTEKKGLTFPQSKLDPSVSSRHKGSFYHADNRDAIVSVYKVLADEFDAAVNAKVAQNIMPDVNQIV